MGGGKWEFAWGPQKDKDSIKAIHAGIERGLNWIDTAAVYGLGHSETVVGRAIKDLRQRPYVFTKCSLVWDEQGRILHNLLAARGFSHFFRSGSTPPRDRRAQRRYNASPEGG